MRTQVRTSYFFLILHLALANEMRSEGLSYKSAKIANNHRYKNNRITMYEEGYPPANAPFEYMRTPNFDVMLLEEEKTGPMWRKYSNLFQPKDLRNVPQIEVNYGGQISTITKGFRRPSIRLDRSEVESVLATLGGKNHIIILLPRNCNLHSTKSGLKQSSLDEFENEFLPKLLQQLHKRSSAQSIGSDMVDPVIDRILTILDNDEQKMLDDLKRTFEGYPPNNDVMENSIYSSGYTTNRRSAHTNTQYRRPKNRTPKKALNSKTQLKNYLYEDPCNEGYMFLVQNKKNSMDPDSLNDILLRVMKVVTEAS